MRKQCMTPHLATKAFHHWRKVFPISRRIVLATLLLFEGFQASAAPPVITAQPFAQGATFGSSSTFAVEATGSTPLYYQWRKDTVDLPGRTNGTMVLSNVTSNDAGVYSVVVWNTEGTQVSTNARFRVVAPVGVSHLGDWPGFRRGHPTGVAVAGKYAYLILASVVS